MKKFIKIIRITNIKLILLLLLTVLDTALILNVDFDRTLFGNIHLTTLFNRYKYKAFDDKTDKLSRRWLTYAIELGKQDNLSPAPSARLYAYTATIFSDILEATRDLGQANLATAEMLDYLYPHQKRQTANFLNLLKNKSNLLSREAQEILNKHKNRSETDNYHLKWDGQIPKGDFWYGRGDKLDGGAMAGEWANWLIDKSVDFKIPEPPSSGGLRDILEINKVKYANSIVRDEDYEPIVFWNGATTGYDINNVSRTWVGKNTSLAGIWQDILFVEEDKYMDELKYALNQKFLSQTIADSFIRTWEIKYKYWKKTPSMRINSLRQLIVDQPYPSYVSEHASISYAAATVLSYLIPQKREIWLLNAEEAKKSRLLAGVQFDTDNETGEYLGKQIGKEIIKKLEQGEIKSNYPLGDQNNYPVYKSIETIRQFLFIELANMVKSTKSVAARFSKKLFGHRPQSKFIIANEETGLPRLPRANGIAWTDYNDDGYLDLTVVSTWLTNKKNGSFFRDDKGALNEIQHFNFGTFADYDNDGCLDIYVVRSGRNSAFDEIGENDMLFHNNCDGTFTDVTKVAGIRDSFHGSGVAWGDYNNDGFLDLYVGNLGLGLPEVIVKSVNTPSKIYPTRLGITYKSEPNILYRNNGDGTFTNVILEAKNMGVADCPGILKRGSGLNGEELGQKTSYQPAWLDYDNDGWLDLFIATDGGVSPLYRNNGDGTFNDVTKEAGICKGGSGMGVAIGDYDSDLDLDIYVTNTGKNYLWRNNGNDTFTEAAEESGVADLGNGWGTDFFDYDNDGDLDLIVVNGTDPGDYKNDPGVDTTSKDSFYENVGNGKFVNVTQRVGLAGDEYKKAVAHGDYDNDGFTDMYISAIKWKEGSENNGYLYRNLGNKNNWLTLQLVGTKSNRDAVGAKIILKAGGKSQLREITLGSSHSSQNSLWQTFGLGKNKSVDEILIHWPSGLMQKLNDIKANQKIVVAEGK